MRRNPAIFVSAVDGIIKCRQRLEPVRGKKVRCTNTQPVSVSADPRPYTWKFPSPSGWSSAQVSDATVSDALAELGVNIISIDAIAGTTILRARVIADVVSSQRRRARFR